MKASSGTSGVGAARSSASAIIPSFLEEEGPHQAHVAELVDAIAEKRLHEIQHQHEQANPNDQPPAAQVRVERASADDEQGDVPDHIDVHHTQDLSEVRGEAR